MDELERGLRATLTDDRLQVSPRPDAIGVVRRGVRRRRRRRAAASALTVVIVAAGTAVAVTQLPRSSSQITPTEPQPTAKASKPPLPPEHTVEVPWFNASYDFHHPPQFPGAVPDLSVPWCRAAELSIAVGFQGATGDLAGAVTATNTSSTACAVQGQPALSIRAGDGRELVHFTPEPFYVDAWVKLAPQQRTTAQVQWFQEFCREPAPATIVVGLPHGGGSLTTALTDAPRCNASTDPASPGRLVADGFVHPTDAPFTPEAGLQATLDRAPASVMQGGVIHYRVQLQSMDTSTVALDPCLPYRERLVSRTAPLVFEELHLLDCTTVTSIGDPSTQQTYFDMQLSVPISVPPGAYDLVWQSVLKPVGTVADDVVKVVAAPPGCRDTDLDTTAGSTAAAGGSYYDVMVFKNISRGTCSLYGFPGVQLADGSGHGVQTGHDRFPMTPHLVVLAPGATASATISAGDSGPNGGATPCKPSAGTLVIPPGDYHATLLHIGMRCYDAVTVGAVVPGTRGAMTG